MALSPSIAAYATVAVTGIVLFAIGTPAHRSRELALAWAATPAARAPAAAVQEPPAPAVASAAGVTLRSVSVTWPTSDRMFPGGTAADAINANCLTCHSAGMVLNQPLLTRASWQDEVSKMRLTYKAPIDAEAVPAIVDYLAGIKTGG